MRHDIQKVISERERINSMGRSRKTGIKLNPHLDYEEVDWGPIWISSSRHRQNGHGIIHKHHRENTKLLDRFLRNSVGRSWDDVFSEMCANLDSRAKTNYRFFCNLKWKVTQQVVIGTDGKPYFSNWQGEYSGFYVDPETGILCENRRRSYPYKLKPITSIDWYENVKFQLESFQRPAKCGCVHFKARPKDPKDRYRYYPEDPAVCMHGNEAQQESIWFVVTSTFHEPDEVFRVRCYENEYDRKRFNLTNPGDRYIEYYRDHPEEMNRPELYRKMANKKELKIIRNALANELRTIS